MFGFIYAKVSAGGTKTRARSTHIEFNSLKEKFEYLKECCQEGTITGAPAKELFNFAGNKHVMWVDIDTKNHIAFKRWEVNESFPFPQNSYKLTLSASGNMHLYIATDRALGIDECFSMREWIRNRSPKDVGPFIDRVYGPNNLEPVFIPVIEQRATLPQKLLENADECFKIPELEGGVFSEWCKRSGYKID